MTVALQIKQTHSLIGNVEHTMGINYGQAQKEDVITLTAITIKPMLIGLIAIVIDFKNNLLSVISCI